MRRESAIQIDEQWFKERIFDLINGVWDLEVCPVPESEFVKTEFAEGSYCDILYKQILEAYSSLCERLDVEDRNDKDIEKIIDNLARITKIVSLKMFEYGVLFARRETMGIENR